VRGYHGIATTWQQDRKGDIMGSMLQTATPSTLAGLPAPSGISAPTDVARRRELADFLRSRRARIAPEDVGLAPGRRRRTPGLRREEIAELASVGVTWYTWLEQGRAINPSAEVVEAIATALRLDDAEVDHLHTLAGTQHQVPLDGPRCVGPDVRAILAALEPCPALVVNGRYDILAWNRPEAALVGDLGALPEHERNVLWLAFTNPAWRSLLVDYDDDTRRMVARFRSHMSRHLGEPAWQAQLARLNAASPLFRELWERHEVSGISKKTKRFLHPVVGLVSLDHTVLRVADVPDVELRVYTPADESARAAMERLLAG
jgi:transcriptional regulator with XRE-family HTH domain